MTKGDLAALLGTDRTMVARLESGKHQVWYSTVRKFIAVKRSLEKKNGKSGEYKPEDGTWLQNVV